MSFLAAVLVVALFTPTLPADDVDAHVVGPPAEIVYGDSGAWVDSLNERLAAAGFHSNEDDTFGRQTRHAVFAFQKHYELETDGVFRAEMWDLLDTEIALPYRKELNRVEIDLAKQVLYVVENGHVEWVIPVSTGTGGTYRSQSGGYARASTPEGKFSFDRKVNGYRHAFLGTLYNPYYFRGGYAVHGSSSVPNYPASHGCVRVTNWDMDMLKTRFELGWTVYVYGVRTDAPPRLEIPNPELVPL